MLRLIIPGTFPSLNDFIAANRRHKGNWNAGNSMKQKDQKRIMQNLPKYRCKPPVVIEYTYYCQNRKRDLDNVSGYFHKVFQDALVEAHVLENDSWRFVVGMTDTFAVDPHNPRIEVIIRERGE